MRAVLCIAMLASSSVATAQIAPGQSGHSSQRYFSGQVAWDTLTEFGNCYASREREQALQLVSTPPGSLDEAKTYKRLFRKADQGCLGDVSSLSVPWQFVRGAVAEGFFQKRIPVPANLATTVPMLPENTKSLSDVALCYVARHPEQARALVETTRPGTKKESEAISAMMDGMAECLPPNLPEAPQFDTMLIRFRIAEALWRRGMVRSESGPVATKANP
jgi:hypothetical protein